MLIDGGLEGFALLSDSPCAMLDTVSFLNVFFFDEMENL